MGVKPGQGGALVVRRGGSELQPAVLEAAAPRHGPEGRADSPGLYGAGRRGQSLQSSPEPKADWLGQVPVRLRAIVRAWCFGSLTALYKLSSRDFGHGRGWQLTEFAPGLRFSSSAIEQ